MSAWAQLRVMDFFCLIALRDWFINLCDRIPRAAAGEQALDHYWPCGRCVSPPTSVTSLRKRLQGGWGTNNEPRPLASQVLFCFVFSHGLILTLSWVNKRPYRSADIDGPLASSCQSINQSEKVLNSNRDLIIRVFKSLIVAFTFSSHKSFIFTLFHLRNYFTLGFTSLDQKTLKYQLCDSNCWQNIGMK